MQEFVAHFRCFPSIYKQVCWKLCREEAVKGVRFISPSAGVMNLSPFLFFLECVAYSLYDHECVVAAIVAMQLAMLKLANSHEL